MSKNESQVVLSERAYRVLNAAKKLFLQHGYDATSLEMVIKESGGSRRTVYAEFGNKQQLFQAVIMAKVNELTSQLDNIEPEESIEKTLQKICYGFLSTIMSKESIAGFRLLISTIDKLPDLGEHVYQAGPMTSIEPLANYLIDLNNKGYLRIDDPVHACQLLLSMVKGNMHIRGMLDPNYSPTEDEITQQVDSAVKFFLNSVNAKEQ